jgi:hypothetical protein
MKLRVLLLAFWVQGCATTNSIYSEESLAKIVAVQRAESYTDQSSQMIAAGGIFVDVPTSTKVQNYTYTLEVGGVELRTKSSSKFRVNDCVLFRHWPYAVPTNPEYNYIDGVLEKNVPCAVVDGSLSQGPARRGCAARTRYRAPVCTAL